MCKKSIIFSDISMSRLGKTMSVTMENMAESHKKGWQSPNLVKSFVLSVVLLRLYTDNTFLSKISLQ